MCIQETPCVSVMTQHLHLPHHLLGAPMSVPDSVPVHTCACSYAAMLWNPSLSDKSQWAAQSSASCWSLMSECMCALSSCVFLSCTESACVWMIIVLSTNNKSGCVSTVKPLCSGIYLLFWQTGLVNALVDLDLWHVRIQIWMSCWNQCWNSGVCQSCFDLMMSRYCVIMLFRHHYSATFVCVSG